MCQWSEESIITAYTGMHNVSKTESKIKKEKDKLWGFYIFYALCSERRAGFISSFVWLVLSRSIFTPNEIMSVWTSPVRRSRSRPNQCGHNTVKCGSLPSATKESNQSFCDIVAPFCCWACPYKTNILTIHDNSPVSMATELLNQLCHHQHHRHIYKHTNKPKSHFVVTVS